MTIRAGGHRGMPDDQAHAILWEVVHLVERRRRVRRPAIQVLLPDRTGAFPDEPAYAGPPQPLLA